MLEGVILATCQNCQKTEQITVQPQNQVVYSVPVTAPDKVVYSVPVTAPINSSPAVTTYTVISPVGPGGLLYVRDRVGRLPQLRILQIR